MPDPVLAGAESPRESYLFKGDVLLPESDFSTESFNQDIEQYRLASEALHQLTSPFSFIPDWDGDDIYALAQRLERYAKANSNKSFNFAFYAMVRKDPRIVALALLQIGNLARITQLLIPLWYFKHDSYDAIVWYLGEYGADGRALSKNIEQLIGAIQVRNASSLMPYEILDLKIKTLRQIARKYEGPSLPDHLDVTGRYGDFIINGVVQSIDQSGKKSLEIFVSLGEKEMAPQEAHPAKKSETYISLFDCFQYSQDILNVMEYLYPDGNLVLRVDFEMGAYHAFFDKEGSYTHQFFISD